MLLAMVLIVQFNIPREGSVWDQLSLWHNQYPRMEYVYLQGIVTPIPARHAVIGMYDPLRAVCELFAGSGLRVHQETAHSFIIALQQPPSPTEAVSPECVLLDAPPPIEVTTPVTVVKVTAPRHHKATIDPAPPTCRCTGLPGPWCYRERDDKPGFDAECRSALP